MKAELNRLYDNKECFVCGKQDHKQRHFPQSQRGGPEKGMHGQSHSTSPTQQQQSINDSYQYTRSKTAGMPPASATPRSSAYKTGSKAVVTETEPAAPEASTQDDDDYVYHRVPREKMAPLNNGLTETVQHQVSQSAGQQYAVTVLHFVRVQTPAPASQQLHGGSSTV